MAKRFYIEYVTRLDNNPRKKFGYVRVPMEWSNLEEADAYAQKLAERDGVYNIEVTMVGAVLDCVEKQYNYVEWTKLKEIFK